MNCPSCAQDVPDGSRFCPNCGQLLVHTEERRIVTVLFSDLVGFTGLSEGRDPEQLKHLIDRCFQRLVADITAFGGTVDKIIGDAIVALFGAPTAHEDDAERAVRAALRMQRTLEIFSKEQEAELQMRIGINTGEVLVGALRAGGDYTAMGDTVNIASRLQTLAAPGEVLVGLATHTATSEAVDYDSRGDIDLRGRDGHVAAFVARAELAPPGRRRDTVRAPLVGRNIEHLHLTTAVDTAVARNRAHLVHILGEAGMGKSRLAEEVAAAAEASHDALVLEGRVLPYGEINPLRAIGEAVSNEAGVLAADSAELATEKISSFVDDVLGFDGTEDDVAFVTEVFLRMIGRPTSLDALDPARRRAETREGIRRFFTASTQHRPTVLVLGDIHWADEHLLQVLEFMLKTLAARPFVLIVTARWTVDESRWISPPGRHNNLVLNLDPLDRIAATRIITALVGAEVPDAVAEQLYDRSGGNPFFLEEIASLLREAGVVGQGARLDEERSIVDLPDNLRGLVAARLDSLNSDERAMVDNASVLGRRGPVYALQLMGGDKEIGNSTFRRLVDKDIFTTEAEWWRFRSDMVRDVAYSMLTRTARAEKHLGVADWLVANVDDPTGESVGTIADH
ncbi:MAG: adenylate/guanylate cyclase domain-containing protein, partial [Actinomycetota bacterium]|nr:adenylate/guanylate cyclase domain-containing protein [Actinomycetota bacterium]